MTTKKKRWPKQRHRSRKHWWFRKTGPLIRTMFRTSLLCYLWSELTEIRFVLKLTIGLTKRHANLNFEFLHSYGPFSHIVSHIYQFKWVHLCYARFFRVEFQLLLNVLYDACIWEMFSTSIKIFNVTTRKYYTTILSKACMSLTLQVKYSHVGCTSWGKLKW
jgi:hypothetical protein